MKNYYMYKFDFCTLGIAESKGAISHVFYEGAEPPKNFEKYETPFKKFETPLLKEAARQLKDYFDKKLKVFDLPISFHGTVFKIKVWEALLKIPYGETRSYGEIAAMIDNPKASQAVGKANHTNQIAIIVPCHRVIGHDGSLIGYAGGLEMKQKLLDLEKEGK